MIVGEIIDLIRDNDAITHRLAQWDFGDGTYRAAVFADGSEPIKSPNPRVVVGIFGGQSGGTRGFRGGESDVIVEVFGDDSQTDKVLRALAFDLWELLNRAELTVSGYTVQSIFANPPVRTNDADGFPGYTMLCRIKYMED